MTSTSMAAGHTFRKVAGGTGQAIRSNRYTEHRWVSWWASVTARGLRIPVPDGRSDVMGRGNGGNASFRTVEDQRCLWVWSRSSWRVCAGLEAGPGWRSRHRIQWGLGGRGSRPGGLRGRRIRRRRSARVGWRALGTVWWQRGAGRDGGGASRVAFGGLHAACSEPWFTIGRRGPGSRSSRGRVPEASVESWGRAGNSPRRPTIVNCQCLPPVPLYRVGRGPPASGDWPVTASSGADSRGGSSTGERWILASRLPSLRHPSDQVLQDPGRTHLIDRLRCIGAPLSIA